MPKQTKIAYVLAFDTANEVIAVGVGRLEDACPPRITHITSIEIEARRASNTKLLPTIDALLKDAKIAREDIACVVCGRGPGSFTGVRIAMATAKGVASALGVGLIGVSSLDAIAWNAWASGVRGLLAVVADAMRKEVYPVRYRISDEGAYRLEGDSVMKYELAAQKLTQTLPGEQTADVGAVVQSANTDASPKAHALQIAGDALVKYQETFEPFGTLLPSCMWTPTGKGLLLAVQHAWQSALCNPFDALRHNPAFVLPVYTRLSDAEENERARLATNDTRDLACGVQGSELTNQAVVYKPLDGFHAKDVAALEAKTMGAGAWSETLVRDELTHTDRTWWMALCADGGDLIGYAGGQIIENELQILKVAVQPQWRRRGIARNLLARVADDARNLGANRTTLEVRASNVGAQALYQARGMRSLGTRPHYYSDGEDALIMEGDVNHLIYGSSIPSPPDAAVACAGAREPEKASVTADTRLSVGAGTGAEVGISVGAGTDTGASGDTNEALEADQGIHEVAAQELLVNMGLRVEQGAFAKDGEIVRAARPLILAIESSCDETAAAIVNDDGVLVANVVASQIDFHARFGGVVPEIASRKHIEAICGVCDECFDVAAQKLGRTSLSWSDVDAIAVTYAPGLVGALVVGVAFAKGAAWGANKPFIGVNHLEGHLYANKLADPTLKPPAVVSLVSGGNTMLVHMKDWGDYVTLGTTIDDAVGEAFDKVAKALDLGYPGGPIMSKQAALGNPDAIAFPRAMMHSGDLRFSLSGLKTAVITYINQCKAAGESLNIPDIAASFQQAVIDVQVSKAKRALEQTGAKVFCLGGGVAANPQLRSAYEQMCAQLDVSLVMAPMRFCGDNAGMIALVALDRYRQKRFFDLATDAHAHASLDEPY